MFATHNLKLHFVQTYEAQRLRAGKKTTGSTALEQVGQVIFAVSNNERV